MWISRKEYEQLTTRNKSLAQSVDGYAMMHHNLSDRNEALLHENAKLRKEIEQLKVKYADEVNKNFELASHLSES